MPVRNSIPLEGALNCWNDPYDFPDLLLAVSRSGKTGRLAFSNPEGDKTVYVKDGKIVFAESSSDDDGLGQFLLCNGQITLAEFRRVSKLVSPGKRLGALLVAEGVLEPKELVPAVIGQVRAIILGLFRRTESWYGFKAEEFSRKESITLEMPVAQLVLDGVQLIDSWRRVSKGLGDLDSVYQVNGATEVEWSRLNLESAPTEILTMLNEPMRVADVCAQASIDDFDACRYLWAFKALDWIEPAPISAIAAAELAERVEMATPLPMAPAAPVPGPAPIPQRLLETQVSAVKEAKPPRPQKPVAPRPAPADLNHTQLAIDVPQPPPPPGPAITRPAMTIPKDVPEALHHTRLYVGEPKEVSSSPPSKTTGEMMEAILEGKADAPAPAARELEPPPIPQIPSGGATQFFPGATALENPPSPEEDFFRGSPGFASLSLDYAASPPAEVPPASPGAPSEPSFSSFAELTPPPSAPDGEMPLVEATLIEATVVEEVNPAPPQLAKTQPSIPPSPNGPSGLELFAVNDPLQTPRAHEAAAPPPSPFKTDDPLQYGEPSIAASLPNRPRTDELDLDIGHFFGDEEK